MPDPDDSNANNGGAFKRNQVYPFLNALFDDLRKRSSSSLFSKASDVRIHQSTIYNFAGGSTLNLRQIEGICSSHLEKTLLMHFQRVSTQISQELYVIVALRPTVYRTHLISATIQD